MGFGEWMAPSDPSVGYNINNSFTIYAQKITEYIEQIYIQFNIILSNAVIINISKLSKLSKIENFDRICSKLRDFFTQMNIYLDINKYKFDQ